MWERRAARWSDAILCVSKGEAALGMSAGIKGAFEVIPNGVDVEGWPFADDVGRAEARTKLGLHSGPLVVCLGRITEQKGQDLLLAAWPGVESEVPGARLILVGDGPSRSEWEPLAAPSVTFAGQSSDPRSWLAAADLVVLPSRWEGMSLTMLEAMASGRPVVSTDVDGAVEALGEEAGAIVPVGDTARLTSEIVRRLKDPARRVTEGLAARRRIEAHFDLRLTFERTASLYEKVLERRKDLYR
jgi:glycosyltransferase involved in cell wall biosynthesis